MSNAIPRPAFPTRQRRSAIGQAAQADSSAPSAQVVDTSAHTISRDQGVEDPESQYTTKAAALQPAAPPPPTTSKRLAGRSKDILLTLPEEEKERMVNTIAWTSPHTGISHQSRFMRYAIAKVCAELEEQFNRGEPFQPPATSAM